MLAVLAAVVLVACGGGDGESGSATTQGTGPLASEVTDDTTPEGLQIGQGPWAPEYEHLRGRLDEAGIPALRVEGTAQDLHAYLLISVHGKPATVPPLIGVNGKEEAGKIVGEGFVSPLHTHDVTGLIHVHATDQRPYTVGEIFDVWGVRFTEDCLAGYCAEGENQLRVYVNGKEQAGDARATKLENGQVIVVVFGTEAEVPSSIPDKIPGG